MSPFHRTLLALALLLPCSGIHAQTGNHAPAQPDTKPAISARLAPGRIEFGKLLADIQRAHSNGDELYMLLWLPEEYWTSSFAREGGAESRQARQILKMLNGYTVFAAVRGTPSPFGRGEFVDESGLRRTIRLTDATGESYQALEKEQIDEDMRSLLEMMRPVFTKMIGNLGENVHFIVFPGKNRAGRPLAAATSNGRLRIRFDEVDFDYRLPLGSLLVPKRDPATGESFPGNYDYNPYTGARLEAAPATK